MRDAPELRPGSLTRDAVLASVRDLPESFTVYKLLDRVLMRAAFEEGIRDLDAGRSSTTSEARRIVQGD